MHHRSAALGSSTPKTRPSRVPRASGKRGFVDRERRLLHFPAYQTKAVKAKTMITVRMSVAKSESMPSIPTLAKMAVSAAKHAESTAQKNQLFDGVSLARE